MKKPISLAHHHKKPNLTEPEKEMEILLKIPPHRIEERKTGLRIQVSRVYAQAYIKEELWNFYYITYASFFLFGMHWPRISFCVFSPYINFTCPQKKKKKIKLKFIWFRKTLFHKSNQSFHQWKDGIEFIYLSGLQNFSLVNDGGINALLVFMKQNPIIVWSQPPINS